MGSCFTITWRNWRRGLDQSGVETELCGMRLRSIVRRLIRRWRVRRWTESLRRSVRCGGALQVNGPGKVVSPASLRIGDNTHFAGDYFIDARGSVEIGENCHISRNFVCYSANHDYEGGEVIPYDEGLVYKKVVIEDNVWIGMNVCLVPGVTIGEGAVVGMGAVVVKDVPPLAVVGGNPSRILKYRDKDHYDRLVSAGRYGGASGALVLKPSSRDETSR